MCVTDSISSREIVQCVTRGKSVTKVVLMPSWRFLSVATGTRACNPYETLFDKDANATRDRMP